MFLNLDNIGFYTLTNERIFERHTNLKRCEIILTSHCNFKCPYCRGVESYSRDCKGHLDIDVVAYTLNKWIERGLENIRFSGGEPTLYPLLLRLVEIARKGNVKRIAISTNGSSSLDKYKKLLDAGVNDFSISLDGCCAENVDKMSGKKGYFESIISNIEFLSEETYVTAGIVLTKDTEPTLTNVIKLAHDLGVSDIRIITAAQYNGNISNLENIPKEILKKYPILNYRVNNLISGRNIRGISNNDSRRCYLVRDDSVVAGKWHFPCVIYMREGGEPIGSIYNDMTIERYNWSISHNTHKDIICKTNCLDCLIDYNNLFEYYHK